jgi:hypothetical protein
VAGVVGTVELPVEEEGIALPRRVSKYGLGSARFGSIAKALSGRPEAGEDDGRTSRK